MKWGSVVLALLLTMPAVLMTTTTATTHEPSSIYVRLWGEVDPAYANVATTQQVRWDNALLEPVEIRDPDGVLWCSLTASRYEGRECTIDNPRSTLGIHEYFLHRTNFSPKSLHLCVSDASSLALTSHSAGDNINGVVVFSGTASSDLGIDRIEARIGGGAWQTATGTTTWSVALDTANQPVGPADVDFRIRRSGCSLAAQEISFVVDNPSWIDVQVSRFLPEFYEGTHGSRAAIYWAVRNLGNDAVTGNVELQVDDGNGWATLSTVALNVPAFSSKSGDWDGYASSFDDYRVRIVNVAGNAADATTLDHYAYWPTPGGPGAPATYRVAGLSFAPTDLDVDPDEQVAWHFRVRNNGVQGADGTWCAPAAQIGDICYRTFADSGAHSFTGTNGGTGVVRVHGTPPSVTITSPGAGTVTGAFVFEGTASSPYGARALDLKIGDGPWQAEADPTAWSVPIDSTLVPNGDVTFSARSRGQDATTTIESITVTVANPSVYDLAVGAVRTADGAPSRDRLLVYATIENQGNEQSQADVILEALIGGSWTEVRRATLTLAGFDETEQLLAWRCAPCTGVATVRVSVDPENLIAEVDEADNSRSFLSVYGAGLIDLP